MTAPLSGLKGTRPPEAGAADAIGPAPGTGMPLIESLVARLFSLVGDAVAATTNAFVTSDRDAALRLVEGEREINDVFDRIEEHVYRLIDSGGTPSATGLHELFLVAQVVPELERSGDLVEHIAWRARQGLARSLDSGSRDLIEQMGRLAWRLWQLAARAYLDRDPTAAEQLRLLDDELDDLHVTLTSVLASKPLPVATAIEVGLVARFLERLGDHAVNVSRRLERLPAGVAGT